MYALRCRECGRVYEVDPHVRLVELSPDEARALGSEPFLFNEALDGFASVRSHREPPTTLEQALATISALREEMNQARLLAAEAMGARAPT
jgi:hypothetical protein